MPGGRKKVINLADLGLSLSCTSGEEDGMGYDIWQITSPNEVQDNTGYNPFAEGFVITHDHPTAIGLIGLPGAPGSHKAEKGINLRDAIPSVWEAKSGQDFNQLKSIWFRRDHMESEMQKILKSLEILDVHVDPGSDFSVSLPRRGRGIRNGKAFFWLMTRSAFGGLVFKMLKVYKYSVFSMKEITHIRFTHEHVDGVGYWIAEVVIGPQVQQNTSQQA